MIYPFNSLKDILNNVKIRWMTLKSYAQEPLH